MSHFNRKIVIMIQFIAILMWVVVVGFPQNSLAETSSAGTLKDSFQVSSGVNYQDIRLGSGATSNAVRVMELNMDDPYTKVELGYPSGLNHLVTVTSQASSYQNINHMVVGAINGSLFQFEKPMYLVVKDGQIVHSMELFGNNQSFVNEPLAFGMDKNGTGMIDQYQLKLTYTYGNTEYKITGVNDQRLADTTILYTSDFPSNYTDTNSNGEEVIVSLPSKPTLTFGSTYEGKVVGIRKYGENTKTEIPENGFVLSGHGQGFNDLKNVEIGDAITLNIDIDQEWKNASLMLGNGPMLVKNGKVALSMDPNSSRAREVAPRTAVAIDKTGKKVFFVTVDGRQSGYSRGMNLTDFASYLVSLGADRAINLDGGGSTTMDVRFPGNEQINLANSPSDGNERAVSTFLMAISTEPLTRSVYYRDIQPGDTHYEGVEWLSQKGIQGYEDGTFGTEKALTRPHAAVMFSKALGLNVSSTYKVQSYFNDVSPGDLYANYIAAVGDAGIFKGSNNNFLPDKGLTREQMASTLVNAFGLKSNGHHVNVNLDNVSPTHQQNVQILADLGITNQLSDFRPKEVVTRGQFATFLYLSQKVSSGE